MNYYRDLAGKFVEKAYTVLGESLIGIYLHGSMAMGCFNPNKSDIDLIVVVNGDISDKQKLELMNEIVKFNSLAPAKGFEISFVKSEYCKPFVYPTPFELHFSSVHLDKYKASPEKYIKEMKGVDKDLAAHFTVINNYGKVLYGRKISEDFGEVPRADHIDSIYYDIENAVLDITDNPVYVTLNLCRVLCFLCSGQCVSKADGGRWALRKPGFDNDIVNEALDCYLSDKKFEYDSADLRNFAEKMLKAVKDRIDL